MFFVSGWRLVAGKVRSAIELPRSVLPCRQRIEGLNQKAQGFFRTFTRVLLQVRTLAAMQTTDNG
jgi:hypothetical protein